MIVFIRCDGGTTLGTGHIIRQLMIAKELKKQVYAKIKFLMQDIPEGISKVEKEGFPVQKIPKTTNLISEAKFMAYYLMDKNPDLLILDVLDTSREYVQLLKKLKTKIISFDDHSEAKYLVDLRFNILEPGIELSAPNLFEGPEYVTLHPVYTIYHQRKKEIRKQANRILITFGGSDPKNLTNKVLKALEKSDRTLKLDIIVGFAFSYSKELKKHIKKSKHKIMYYENISPQKMAQLMFESDIGIGAGGLTQYEFSCSGLPAIVICEDVSHQYKLANWFQTKGALINLGMGRSVSEEKIYFSIINLLEDYCRRKRMSINGKKLCDGKGLQRTIEKILEIW